MDAAAGARAPVIGGSMAVLSAVGLLAVAERGGLGQAPDRKRLGCL